jgi:hypothetical protein
LSQIHWDRFEIFPIISLYVLSSVLWCLVRLYLPLFAGGLMSHLRYLCLLAHSGVQHIPTVRVTWLVSYKMQLLLSLRGHLSSLKVFCVVFFVLFVLVMCLVHPMLAVSLDCPFLIAYSVFSNVYLERMFSNVSNFSWLFILDCPFGFH